MRVDFRLLREADQRESLVARQRAEIGYFAASTWT